MIAMRRADKMHDFGFLPLSSVPLAFALCPFGHAGLNKMIPTPG